MGISVFERRKFVRLAVNLDAHINRDSRATIKTLSLGGCLLETPSNFDLKESVRIKFLVIGKSFEVQGRPVHRAGKNQFAIRFENQSNEQNIRLVRAIEKIYQTNASRRPTRVSVQQEALLDREPAMLTNLSEGGCFLKTSGPFHPNDIVEIKFKLQEDEIHLAGQVRWIHPKGIGIEYLSPEPTQINSISQFINIQSPPSKMFS
jgi:hypothetical protein